MLIICAWVKWALGCWNENAKTNFRINSTCLEFMLLSFCEIIHLINVVQCLCKVTKSCTRAKLQVYFHCQSTYIYKSSECLIYSVTSSWPFELTILPNCLMNKFFELLLLTCHYDLSITTGEDWNLVDVYFVCDIFMKKEVHFLQQYG